MDERFLIDSDPRFIRPKKRGRVVLDSRFSSILDPDFSEQPSFDRYGRRIKRNKKDLKAIESLYVLPEGILEDSFLKKKNKKLGKIKDDLNQNASVDTNEVENDQEDVDSKESEHSELFDDDMTSSDDDSNISSEELDLVDPEPEEEIPRGKMTSRLAAVNLDWDHIRSVDIFAALSSFVPKGGRILSVRVYPSEFGKKRMEKEDMEGPPKEIFSKVHSTKGSDIVSKKDQSSIDQDASNDNSLVLQKFLESKEPMKHSLSSSYKDQDDLDSHSGQLDYFDNEDSTNDNEDGTNDNDDDDEIKRELLKEDDGDDFNMAQLRKYQLERLRYYYAIVVCDSINTAKSIYEQCDGREYEASANFFDLRFVPDEESFDSMEVRDESLSLPENYVPDEFVTDALKHSNVKLMWDNDDPVYTQMVKRAFSGKEINENDFKAYLASTDSETSDIEMVKKKYRSLLLENEKDLIYDKDSIVGNMQVTFMPGLEHEETKETHTTQETTLEKYMKKEKERKQRKREKKLSMRKNETKDVDNCEKNEQDLGFDDPFFLEKPIISSKKAKRKTHIKDKQMDNDKAELELLMMDEAEMMGKNINHFDMNEILKMEKKKKSKRVDSKELQDTFEIDVNDPRFSAVYSSHHFAIDPTNPRFKKTKSMIKIIEERQRRMNMA